MRALLPILILGIVSLAQAAVPVAKPPVAGSSEVVYVESVGKVDYYATGRPSLLKIHGVSNALHGQLTRTKNVLTGTFEIAIRDFDSGMKTRDTHLREKLLEADKYPTATLTLESLPINDGENKQVHFKGKLKLHGVEKPVEGVSTLSLEGTTLKHTSNFEVTMTDFSLEPPSFAGMKVDNLVKLEVTGIAEAKK